LKENQFSQEITVFQGRKAPEPGFLAGYGALITALELLAPLPDRLSLISHQHKKYETEEWLVFTPRYKPEDSFWEHLVFALKYEGLDLLILKRIFQKVPKATFESLIKAEYTGQYSRRIWFLYEWLIESELNIPDVTIGNLVNVLDEDLQFPGPSETSKRHRVRNNLPGVKSFCPLIRKTQTLQDFIATDFKNKLNDYLGNIRQDVVMRAASFLLLKDSKASYAIEGESPAKDRAQRWGQAIGQAGRNVLTQEEFIRLQQIVIDNPRFTKMGWRKQGGFVGEHDRETGMPLPDHISARWQDVDTLISGIVATDQKLEDADYDAVLAATLIAFGFVFVHPFVDGNGRIHRYLIHHVLSRKKFVSSGVIFPVSSVILQRADEYKKVLENYSIPRLELIKWATTPDNNIEVLNETIDLYRFFDATRHAEFLYSGVQQAVEKTIPEEVMYLGKYDRFKTYLDNSFQMPDRTVALLVRFLEQGKGQLSERAKAKEFELLSEKEASDIEKAYKNIFFKMNEVICVATDKKQRLQFEYNGKIRVVEPQCYGIGMKDTELLRGYEIKGDVQKSNKLYDLSKVKVITALNEFFTEPGPNYTRDDSAMKMIFCQL
jgi:hypothetical protein